MPQPNTEVDPGRTETCDRSRFGTFSECPQCCGCDAARARALPVWAMRVARFLLRLTRHRHPLASPWCGRTRCRGAGAPCCSRSSSRIRKFATGREKMAMFAARRWFCGEPRRADHLRVTAGGAFVPSRRGVRDRLPLTQPGGASSGCGSIRATPTSFPSDGRSAPRGSNAMLLPARGPVKGQPRHVVP